MRLSGAIGITLLAIAIVGGIMLGGNFNYFVNPPSLLFIICFALGAALLSFGWGDTWQALRLVCAPKTNASHPEQAAQIAITIRGIVRHVYAASVVGAMIGIIQVAQTGVDTSKLHAVIAVILLCPFYGLVLAECLLRPACHRADTATEC